MKKVGGIANFKSLDLKNSRFVKNNILLIAFLVFILLINISFISAQTNILKVTDEHPFFVFDSFNVMQEENIMGKSEVIDDNIGKWKKANELKVGDLLVKDNGKKARITSIKGVIDDVEVYNLEANPFNDYITEGNVVVHNSNKVDSGIFPEEIILNLDKVDIPKRSIPESEYAKWGEDGNGIKQLPTSEPPTKSILENPKTFLTPSQIEQLSDSERLIYANTVLERFGLPRLKNDAEKIALLEIHYTQESHELLYYPGYGNEFIRISDKMNKNGGRLSFNQYDTLESQGIAGKKKNPCKCCNPIEVSAKYSDEYNNQFLDVIDQYNREMALNGESSITDAKYKDIINLFMETFKDGKPNYGLLNNLCKEYKVELEDGLVYLWEAMLMYDKSKGKFSTLAYSYFESKIKKRCAPIKNYRKVADAITDFIRRNPDYDITSPTDSKNKLYPYLEELFKNEDGTPIYKRSQLGMALIKYRKDYLKGRTKEISSMGCDEENPYQVSDPFSSTPLKDIAESEAQNLARAILSSDILTPDEAEAWQMYYIERIDQTAIAKLIGVVPQRISQLTTGATLKVRFRLKYMSDKYKNQLKNAVDQTDLSKLQREVISLYFGFNEKSKTFEEISQITGSDIKSVRKAYLSGLNRIQKNNPDINVNNFNLEDFDYSLLKCDPSITVPQECKKAWNQPATCLTPTPKETAQKFAESQELLETSLGIGETINDWKVFFASRTLVTFYRELIPGVKESRMFKTIRLRDCNGPAVMISDSCIIK